MEDEDIINLIKRTCARLSKQEILEINDVTATKEPRPFIKITCKEMLNETWLYDTGASITCMSLEKFRSIPEGKKPKRLNIPIREAKAADGNKLIPHGV